MRVFYALLLLVINGSFVQAQGIVQGKITDEKNLPIPGATIRLQKLADTTLYQALTTDSSGSFIFKNIQQGNYRLEASFLGYQQVRRMINCRDSLTDAGVFTLRPAVTQLHEVAIQAKIPLIEK